MPILAQLSRRLQMLTTDAKPDPPRIKIKENSHNKPTRNSDKTLPTISVNDSVPEIDYESIDRRDSIPECSAEKETRKNSGEKKNTKFKTTKSSKNRGQAANIVNYNIVNSSGIKIGATTTYICNVNQVVEDTRKNSTCTNETSPKLMPDCVERLAISEKEINIDDMFLVKTHAGSTWRSIFKFLNYSEGQLDVLEESHKTKGLDEVIYQALLDWKQASGKDAKIGVLTKALWKSQHYDCAERLAAAHET